jgi:hypothetical protein
MVIDFVKYVEMKKAEKLTIQAAFDAELARRERLESILTELLAELEAA